MITVWVRKHILVAFFSLTFLVSWILWGLSLLTVEPGELISTGPTPAFLMLALLGGFGPSAVALILLRVAKGKGGARQLLAGLKPPRVAVIWYIPALLLLPAVTLLLYALQRGMSWPVTLGGGAMPLAIGLIWPLFASLGEELGWRGLALPRLQTRFGPLLGTLILGGIWGLWHLLSDYIGIGNNPDFWLNWLLLGPVLLTAHAVIMTWLYNRTGGSLLMVVLYHYSITFCAILLAVQGLSAAQAPLANLLSAGIWCVIALIVAISSKGRLGLDSD